MNKLNRIKEILLRNVQNCPATCVISSTGPMPNTDRFSSTFTGFTPNSGLT